MEQLYFKTRDEWRDWLKKNHKQKESILLIFYKKSTRKPTMDYNSAVEEALCYGWIDSIKKRLDDEKYTFKFSPRNSLSKWSESNKKRVAKLIKEKRMTKHGMKKIDAAKQNGMWYKEVKPEIPAELPLLFEEALNKNKTAKTNFENLAPSYRKQYIGWIFSAKKDKTINKRIEESVNLLEQGKKLGMK